MNELAPSYIHYYSRKGLVRGIIQYLLGSVGPRSAIKKTTWLLMLFSLGDQWELDTWIHVSNVQVG